MTPAAEAARHGALIVAEPTRGTLRVTGPDRVGWLNGIVTCDVARASAADGALGLVLNKTGKILSDLTVLAASDALFLGIAPGTDAELLEHFDRMLVMEDAEIRSCSADHVWLGLHGPRSAELARDEAARSGGVSGALDWSGLGGAALLVPRDGLEDVLARLTAKGPQVHVATEQEWVAHRLERAIPLFGVDFGNDDNPHEASLDQRAVCWTKGCYLGQEVVCMQGMRGRVKRRLVALLIEGDDLPARGASVHDAGGATVGEVTSAARGEAVSGSVALAKLTGSVLAEDEPVLRVGQSPARIVERPDAA